MTAKMKSKKYRKDTRKNWDMVRSKVMRWCLEAKLAQNWEKFGRLLLETEGRSIVEESRKDKFWGAHPQTDGTLAGRNVLGRLLMELREQLQGSNAARLIQLKPLELPDFWLYGEPIRIVDGSGEGQESQLGLRV